MIHCKKPECRFEAWRRRLCYRHWRESQGFVFDPELRVFVHATSTAARGETEARVAAEYRRQESGVDLFVA
jgi:hypothetical protein